MPEYWEEYSDQNPEEFKWIGVNNYFEPIVNIEAQVTELKRRYGRNCIIKIAREGVVAVSEPIAV